MTHELFRPVITVDIIVYSLEKNSVLLIKRGNAPFKGCYALPGGFLDPGETLGEAAARELREETGIDFPVSHLSQFDAVYAEDRDPRGPSLTVVYTALLEAVENYGEVKAGDDAADAEWVSLSELGDIDMAFDHRDILDNFINMTNLFEELGLK